MARFDVLWGVRVINSDGVFMICALKCAVLYCTAIECGLCYDVLCCAVPCFVCDVVLGREAR